MKTWIILILVAITLWGVSRERERGAFHGEAAFAAVTASYSRTKDEAEKILHENLNREGTADQYVYFPHQIIYAHDGGYLFVVGDFKVNFALEGFYVDSQGGVRWLDLERNLSVADYKGSREKSRLFKD